MSIGISNFKTSGVIISVLHVAGFEFEWNLSILSVEGIDTNFPKFFARVTRNTNRTDNRDFFFFPPYH